jgi:hypothetical protein
MQVPVSSGNKMCETCRSRHRVYANTKRAKRKMEKAAVNLQTLEGRISPGETVWMPESSSVTGLVSPTQNAGNGRSGSQVVEVSPFEILACFPNSNNT